MTIYRIERIDRVRKGEPACARNGTGYTFARAPEAGYAIWLAGLCEVVFVPDSALRDCKRRAGRRPAAGQPLASSSNLPSTSAAASAVQVVEGFAARAR